MTTGRPRFYEFFAGGGMVRAGLGEGWECLLANDLDPRKAESYRANWGDADFRLGDIGALTSADMPGEADLAWASFPCQDLSLAGSGAGLKGARSSTFWAFWRLMGRLRDDGRAPAIIALENVCGALTSHGGRDFAAIGAALARGGYRFGAVVIDAARFLPQSRPRLFIIALREDIAPPGRMTGKAPQSAWTTSALLQAQGGLDAAAREAWLWWRLPEPPLRNARLKDVIEDDPADAPWRSAQQTEKLLSLMAPTHRARVIEAQSAERRAVGAVYRRTRPDGAGGRIQRAEVRFDGLAGCLRTPAGGSSRQTLLVVEGGHVRSRLLSRREAARLMGLPEKYRLPKTSTDAYRLLGDGVAVPAARHLAAHLFEPLLGAAPESGLDRALAGSLSEAIS